MIGRIVQNNKPLAAHVTRCIRSRYQLVAASKRTMATVNEVMDMFTLGGDDRLQLDKVTKTNKYYIAPKPDNEAMFRGSCTCNFPTLNAYNAASETLDKIEAGEMTVFEVFEDCREKIAQCYQLPDGSGVFMCPSGSDAEYFPLLFAKLLNPATSDPTSEEHKDILSIVTCLHEIGAGTMPASGGKLFSWVLPTGLPTNNTEQEGNTYLESVKQGIKGIRGISMSGTEITGLTKGVEVVTVDARNASGEVVDATAEIAAGLDRCEKENMVPLIHTVHGSKTGVVQKIEPEHLERLRKLNGVHVVDACQCRFQLKHLKEWLSDSSTCVLITGSKFYRGPPFSGGVLVNPHMMKRLAALGDAAKNRIPYGLEYFVGRGEIPPQLAWFREALPESTNNKGLALRWVAAIAEMTKLAKIPEYIRIKTISAWREQVISYVNDHNLLNYFSQARDTDSIVSIRVRHPKTQAWLKKEELAILYRCLTLDMTQSKFLKPKNFERAILSTRCFIGQPVLINADEAVLRLALGANGVCELCEDKDYYQVDQMILRKMQLLAEYYSEIESEAHAGANESKSC